MDLGKKLMIWFYGLLFAVIVLWAWIWNSSHKDDTISLDNLTVLSADLQQEGSVRSYTAVLPEAFQGSQSIFFKSSHTEVEVLVGDVVVYTFGTVRGKFGKSPGTYWHVVDIPEDSAGKTLTVRQMTVYDAFSGTQTDLKYGSRGDCILGMIRNLWGVVLLNCVILFAGVISLFLHIATSKKKDKGELGSFVCIGFFAMTIAVWSLCQYGFWQFLIPNALIMYFIEMLAFFLFPVPFNLFIYTICRSEYKKGFAYIAAAYMVEMVLMTILQLAGIWDIHELLRAIHVLMALNAIYVFWAIWQERRLEKDSMASRFRIPLYILMVFGIMEMVSYYARIFDDSSVFLLTGTVIFIAMLIWQQVTEYYHRLLLLEEQKMQYYEMLAKTDILTGAKNRNAYEAQLNIMEAPDADLQGQCIILFDLNNMKIINDNFGHEKGDEALKICYDCMQKMFGDKGICYRIGGDEFAFLSRDAKDLSNAITDFNKMIEHVAQQVEYPFCVALGYAVFDPDKDEDFRSTIRRGDAKMYEDKKRKKEIVLSDIRIENRCEE